jgi:hypothetical protein
MNLNTLRERFASLGAGSGRVRFRLPSVVVEIQPEFVLAAKLDGRARRVRRLGAAELQPGSIKPDPGRPNVANPDGLREAVHTAIRAVGDGGGVGLLLPDGAVRTAVLPFETVPQSEKEFDALVRWRIKQNLPGAPEEVRLSYQAAPRETGGADVLALAIKSSVVSEYQFALDGNKDGFDLVLPVTAALLPLLPAESGAQLLLNVCCGWMTSVLICANVVSLWRTRELIHGDAAELPRAIATEAARVVASGRDHIHLDITRVWLCARPRLSPDLTGEVGRALAQEVRSLVPSSEMLGALPQPARATFQEFGAALGGLLMNG